MESEEEGVSLLMVSDLYPRIGGCQRDKTLFYMGSTDGLCPFCAQPPNFVANLPVATAPFAPVDWNGQADPAAPREVSGVVDGMPSDRFPEDTATPEQPVDLPTQCPACFAELRAVISEAEFQLQLATPSPSAETPPDASGPRPTADVAPSDEGTGDAGPVLPESVDAAPPGAPVPSSAAEETSAEVV